MPMTPAQKKEEAASIHSVLKESGIVVVTRNDGLNADATNTLRVSTRAAGVTYRVAKNTIVNIAAKGTEYESITNLLTGPTAISTSKDPIAAAKAINEFAKKNDKLVILGGAMGSLVLDAESVKKLANLPSLNELRSKLVGLLVAGPTKLVGVLQAPARQMIGVTKAYGEKA
jgi:large subunit ribosomal protein L10